MQKNKLIIMNSRNLVNLGGWPNIAWDRIGKGILYPILCFIGDGIKEVTPSLIFAMFNQTLDEISNGICYPPSFFSSFSHGIY